MKELRYKFATIVLLLSLGVNYFLLKDIYQNNSCSFFKIVESSKAVEFVRGTEEIRNRFIEKEEKLLGKNSDALVWDLKKNLYIWHFFPPTFTCPHLLERIGRLDDGGKWICGLQVFKDQQDCTVYSFGVGGDSSFEREILDRTPCRIWAYDYTVNSMQLGLPPPNADILSRVKFQKLGLGDGKNTSKPDMRTLDSLMKENGHDWIDFLKIDIEGAEFATLSQIQDHFGVLPFGHLNLEIHLPPLKDAEQGKQKAFFNKMWEWWGQLEDGGLRAYFWEDNHIPCVRGGRPTAMEYSFINVEVGRNKLLKF